MYENLDDNFGVPEYPAGSVAWSFRQIAQRLKALELGLEFDTTLEKQIQIEPQSEEMFMEMLGMEKQIESIT